MEYGYLRLLFVPPLVLDLRWWRECISVNIGKVVLMQDPTRLNVPALVWTMRRLLGLLVIEEGRNSFVQKIRRNALELQEIQRSLDHLDRIERPLLLS